MTYKWLRVLAFAYVAGIVICFGPATAQSEQADALHDAECRKNSQSGEAGVCAAFGPNDSDGLPKALFWPLWLSYTIASEGAKR